MSAKTIVSIRTLTEQDILELDALHLCNTLHGQNIKDWSELSPVAKERWVKVALEARSMNAVTA